MSIIQCKNIPLKSFAILYTNGKGKSFCPLSNLISSGNIKIPSTTAIFNMSSATDCPSARLGLCKAKLQGAKCYALKSEYSYRPNVLKYRKLQEKYWKNITSKEFVSQFILINSLKQKPFNLIRFNESGDFHSQECLNKAEEISMMLRRFGIRCYCYTSRNDLDFSKIKHLVVSGSGFIKKGISNEFKIIGKKEKIPKGYGICKGNCKICKRCTMRNLKTCIRKH